MRFDWDGRKAVSNLLKHHISFEDAITAFDDPFALVAPDPKHSTATEERRWLIGESDIGVVVVVFTVRQPDNIYRIITARRASRKEGSRYDEAKSIPL
jgi:uncharacterized DUF497 family protein